MALYGLCHNSGLNKKVERTLAFLAAKRRKNTAHGASRGKKTVREQAPRVRKRGCDTVFSTSQSSPRRSKRWGLERSGRAAIYGRVQRQRRGPLGPEGWTGVKPALFNAHLERGAENDPPSRDLYVLVTWTPGRAHLLTCRYAALMGLQGDLHLAFNTTFRKALPIPGGQLKLALRFTICERDTDWVWHRFTNRGETPIWGRDVRDASLYCRPGTEDVILDVKIFSRTIAQSFSACKELCFSLAALADALSIRFLAFALSQSGSDDRQIAQSVSPR